ncbi:cytochrome P450 [Leucogyrophana mollusca]|uniref:Cytochrome P450 n=1 Tax=Leucogyrophana mollusca TaxID=85980 RepID=A0ACB8B3R4_9AGAM|nr:cytochrome P450 [Leucogyrophana mollusca]
MSSVAETSAIALFCVFGFTISSLVVKRYRSPVTLPLPPGPPPLPVLGNALDIKGDEPWISYTEWGATYGDLIYSPVLNLDIIVINSEDVAKSLLEKRSHNFSDRPLGSVNKLRVGLSFVSALLGYGDTWRMHRRILHQAFRPAASVTYLPTQLRKARELLINLHDSPEDYEAHLQLFTASTIMSIVYGYTTAPRNDHLVNVVERAAAVATKVVSPARAAVLASFPALKSIPSWFPGVSFQREVVECRKYATEMVEAPFKYVQDKMASGATIRSMVSDAVKKDGGVVDPVRREAIKGASATAFLAGAETASSTLRNFVLAMVLNPQIQQRAQEEIDAIVGTDRLPTFGDRDSLPFVEAIIRETLRWHPVLPLGLAHATTSSDVFGGYAIPKGATIIANAWAMSRNEAKYPNASDFKPERWLKVDGSLVDERPDFVFGFGRRFCVGRHLAEASLWSAIASMLSIFNFIKSEEFEPKWTFGATSHPISFPCRIVPRSPCMTLETLTQMIQAETVV